MKVKEVMKRLERLDPEAEVGFDEVGIREINVDHSIEELADGRPYKCLDLQSEIPVENRVIKFKPLAVKANKDTDPKHYMTKINELLNENKHLNTVIHVTYKLQAR